VFSIILATIFSVSQLTDYTEQPEIPGGEFTAIQGDDALWTIKAVPILAEMEVGERRNREKIDAEWMRQAIQTHRSREADGHLPAVHEEHHDNGERRKRLGFFRPTHVGSVKVLGKSRDALFADIVGVDPEDFESMKELRLPYRSIEVNASWNPEIESLALLESEAPHHKLPMLTLGEVQENPYVVALCRGDESLFIVQRLGGGPMPRSKKRAAESESPVTTIKLQEDEKPDEEETEGLGGDIDGKIKELQDSIPGMISDAIAAKIEEIQASLGSDESDEPEENLGDDNEEKPLEPVEQYAENGEEEEDMKKLQSLESLNARTAGRLAALEKKQRDRETADSITQTVDAECDKLRAEGWAIDETVKSDMVKLAEGAVDPAATVGTFAASYRKSTPQDPPEDVEQLGQRGLLTGNETIESLPDEVLAYRDRGPDAFAHAVELHSEYESLASRMRGFDRGRETLKDHLEINWRQ